jgi:hypothetical protein
MRRKVYDSGYERKHDQRIGAIAFVVVNVIVWLLYRWLSSWLPRAGLNHTTFFRLSIAIELMPWVVNGAVLVWAFIFRPQIGIGYITSFGAILVAAASLAALFIVSCVASIPFMLMVGPVGLLAFFVLGVIGLIWLVKTGLEKGWQWWSAEE